MAQARFKSHKSNLRTLILGLWLAFAHSSLSNAETGFYLKTDPKVPAAVRESAKSVYQFFGVIAAQDSDKWVVSTSDKAYYEVIQDPKQYWLKDQFDSCVKAGEKFCTLYRLQKKGTAFLFQSPTTLVTNFHNVEDAVKDRFQRDENSVLGMPLFLNLREDNLINFESPNGTPHLDFVTPQKSLLGGNVVSSKSLELRLADFVEINLPEVLGKPLRKASREPAIGETLYVVGYPKASMDRAAFGKRDSDGKTQYVSIGKRISLEEYEKLTGDHIDPSTREQMLRHVLYGDFDCEIGNSGGPILNARGEVVAILTTKFNPVGQRVCAGLMTMDRPSLSKLWQEN